MKYILPVVIICMFILLSVGSMNHESLTFDEIVYREEGIAHLTKRTFNVDTNNPPLIREIAMLPSVIGIGIPPRVIILGMGVVLLISVYLTVNKYFGFTRATVALFLLALEPTILANSHYLTLDTGFTLFFFLAYVAFLRLNEKYSVMRLIGAGVIFGFAAASKLFALPFFALSVLPIKPKKFNISSLLKFLGIAVIIIWASYLFVIDPVIVARADDNRISSQLHKYAIEKGLSAVDTMLTLLETKKIPLGNYLAVIKNTIVRSTQQQQVFFMGSFYDQGKWYFLPVTLLFKIPIPLLMLFALGLLSRVPFFTIPIFTIIIIASLFNIQPLVRYVLPAIPFMVIAASGSVSLLFTRFQKLIFTLLILWYGINATSAFPHFITYANELTGHKDKRFLYFMDSNLDWGQTLISMRKFIDTYKPSRVNFSYFGRDDGRKYGLPSDVPYVDHRHEQICAFHPINFDYSGPDITVISVSNWYYCNFYNTDIYAKEHIDMVIDSALLVFYE